MNAFPSPEQSFSKSAQLDESSGDLQHPETWSYETTIAKIEAIIARIELGELALKDVFDHFEIAVEHLQQCEEFLNHHQRRMDLLIETLTDEVENF